MTTVNDLLNLNYTRQQIFKLYLEYRREFRQENIEQVDFDTFLDYLEEFSELYV